MNTVRTCSGCGAALPPDAPGGLCPRCLLQRGLETGPPGAPASSGPALPFVAPRPEDLQQHISQLEVLELLGQGGMGAVYRARQKGLDRIIALKVLPPLTGRDSSFTERFTREARALACLNHPHIVTVHDFGQAGEYFYLTMEFVDGVNLRRLIRDRQLTPRQALVIIPQICEALQYAHDEGIVHRDIKPENILVDKRGRVKIADFGLAKLLGRSPGPMLTGPQEVMGTLHYMAPEQFERPQEVDHRADIYALGVVLYEMLTGQIPMGHFALPSKTAGVDVRLDEIVLRTLARAPDLRYQKVSDIKSDVEVVSGLIANLPPAVRRAFGFEYRSKSKLFGLPLLHIARGSDPVTGRRRVAKGIFAIGDIAIGVMACGGLAAGGFTCGGACLSLLSVGGLAVGLICFGGVNLALVAACGGLAIAPIAMGGFAVGYYASGGWAAGVHVWASGVHDPAAGKLFRRVPFLLINIAGMLLVFIPMVVSQFLSWWLQRREIQKEEAATKR